ncbi:hypothetical protein V8F33_010545 [Rhypophila sp. PSN 637]
MARPTQLLEFSAGVALLLARPIISKYGPLLPLCFEGRWPKDVQWIFSSATPHALLSRQLSNMAIRPGIGRDVYVSLELIWEGDKGYVHSPQTNTIQLRPDLCFTTCRCLTYIGRKGYRPSSHTHHLHYLNRRCQPSL